MRYLMLLCLLGLMLTGCYNNPNYTSKICNDDILSDDGYCLIMDDGNLSYDLVCYDNKDYVKLRVNTFLTETEVLEAISIGWDDCYIVKSK